MKLVIGLDLSLSNTGVGVVGGHLYETLSVKPGKRTGHERLAWIGEQLLATYGTADLVVVEGPAFGAKGDAYHQLAGLWWLIAHQVWGAGKPIAVVSPSALKKYATGKGTAGKDEVLLATARRFDDFAGGNDEADALWLAAMGADHLGVPLVDMPALQRKSLEAVKWPVIT